MPQFANAQELAAAVMAALIPLAPYLGKAAEGAAKQAGEEAWKKAAALLAAIRSRFHSDKNERAGQTLELFLAEPATFESALTTYLLAAVQQHPRWADEVRRILAEPSLQEIIARNHSHLERIVQSLSGPGTQRIEADDSTIGGVRQEKS